MSGAPPWLPDLLAALGWQGGTIHDALTEVRLMSEHFRAPRPAKPTPGKLRAKASLLRGQADSLSGMRWPGRNEGAVSHEAAGLHRDADDLETQADDLERRTLGEPVQCRDNVGDSSDESTSEPDPLDENTPIEAVDAELRAAGGDPVAIGDAGRAAAFLGKVARWRWPGQMQHDELEALLAEVRADERARNRSETALVATIRRAVGGASDGTAKRVIDALDAYEARAPVPRAVPVVDEAEAVLRGIEHERRTVVSYLRRMPRGVLHDTADEIEQGEHAELDVKSEESFTNSSDERTSKPEAR